MQELKIVLGAGAVGGAGSWAYTIIAGTTFGVSQGLALPLCVILGAVSAVVAVYVVIPADTSKLPKLFGFAVLCGLMWKPVLDAAKVAISERISYARENANVTTEIAAIATATAPQIAAAQIENAATSAAELLRSSDSIGSEKLEDSASEQATTAVETIADNAEKNPAAAQDALQEIVAAAAETKNDKLLQLARGKLIAVARMQAPAAGGGVSESNQPFDASAPKQRF